jgi:rare lipoprotein A
MNDRPKTGGPCAPIARRSVAALLPLLAGCAVVGYPAPPPSAATAAAPRDVARTAGATATPGSYEVFGERYTVLATAAGYYEVGVASWYGDEFAGRPTSSGEIFDPDELTAAHRSLPLSTWVEVKNLENGRSVLLRVNDRGPFAETDERIIDVSHAAARALGFVNAGTTRVEVRSVPPPSGGPIGRR